eukprot:TRINITY_DN1481_c0_g1_i1.p1 TRINITY_DN1481_c0_g1~~TRINITY_DN1481_c0_g1_i1.p1  ORF type:complete len:305 (-),score=87.76 TRINITY_DN1481_c0_g1_i1:80-994(-)
MFSLFQGKHVSTTGHARDAPGTPWRQVTWFATAPTHPSPTVAHRRHHREARRKQWYQRRVRGAKAHFVLARHAHNAADYPTSAAHLRTALEIDPSYCEVHYSLGVAMYKLGDAAGVDVMTRGLACPETADMAAEGLKSIYGDTLERDPENVGALVAIGELRETEEPHMAAVYYVNAAIILQRPGAGAGAGGGGGVGVSAVSLARRAVALVPGDCEVRMAVAAVMAQGGPAGMAEMVAHLEAASWPHNCSAVHVVATDALINVYVALLGGGDGVPRWVRDGWAQLQTRSPVAKECQARLERGLSC